MADEEFAFRKDFHDDSGTESPPGSLFLGSEAGLSVPSVIAATGELHLRDEEQTPRSRGIYSPSSPTSASDTQPLRRSLYHPVSELQRLQRPTYLGKPKVTLFLLEQLDSCKGKKTYSTQKGRDEIVFYSKKTGVTVVYPVKTIAIGAPFERVSVDDCEVRVYEASSVHPHGWVGPVIEVSKSSALLDFAEMTIPCDFSLIREEGVAILHAKSSSLSLQCKIDFDVVASFREGYCCFENEYLKAEYNLEERALFIKMKEHCVVTPIAKARDVNIDASFHLRPENDGSETFDVIFSVWSVYKKRNEIQGVALLEVPIVLSVESDQDLEIVLLETKSSVTLTADAVRCPSLVAPFPFCVRFDSEMMLMSQRELVWRQMLLTRKDRSFHTAKGTFEPILCPDRQATTGLNQFCCYFGQQLPGRLTSCPTENDCLLLGILFSKEEVKQSDVRLRNLASYLLGTEGSFSDLNSLLLAYRNKSGASLLSICLALFLYDMQSVVKNALGEQLEAAVLKHRKLKGYST